MFKHALVVFLILLYYVVSPSVTFDTQGSSLPFGTGEGKTLFTFPVIIAFIAVAVRRVYRA